MQPTRLRKETYSVVKIRPHKRILGQIPQTHCVVPDNPKSVVNVVPSVIVFVIQVLSFHLWIYLFGVLHHFQHCTGHISSSFVGRGNKYILLVKVLYCKLPTIGKQLPALQHKVQGLKS